MNEAEHQGGIIDLAERLLWLVYHTHDSRHSAEGFPDLVLVRGDRVIFAELKTDAGQLRPAQKVWLAALEAAGAEVYVWRPTDLDEIVKTLTRRDRPPREAIAA